MVPLSWQTAGDGKIAGYQLERSPTARGPYESLAKIDERYQTTFVDRGLGDLRVFYYRIASITLAGGIGKPSSPVRAATKPEPLPPVNLRATDQQLGANHLAWDPNVEEDIVEYRLFRTRSDDLAPVPVAIVGADQTTAIDSDVGSGERVSYTVFALDRDGLTSNSAEAIEIDCESYDLSATARPDGVHLEWNPRSNEGFRGAQVTRTTGLRTKHFGFQSGNQFHDSELFHLM